MSFYKRLALFVLILAALIMFMGLLPSVAHSAKIPNLKAKISKTAPEPIRGNA